MFLCFLNFCCSPAFCSSVFHLFSSLFLYLSVIFFCLLPFSSTCPFFSSALFDVSERSVSGNPSGASRTRRLSLFSTAIVLEMTFPDIRLVSGSPEPVELEHRRSVVQCITGHGISRPGLGKSVQSHQAPKSSFCITVVVLLEMIYPAGLHPGICPEPAVWKIRKLHLENDNMASANNWLDWEQSMIQRPG